MNRQYVIGKTLRYVLTFFMVVFICFIIPRMMPGDPVENILGMDYYSLPQDVIDRMYREFGLDRGLFEQFIDYLISIFTLNFGYSSTIGSPVSEIIPQMFVRSAIILLPSLLIGAGIALAVGVRVGLRDDAVGKSAITMALIVHSAPAFLIGMAFILVFCYYLGWLPFGHLTSIGVDFSIENIGDILYHMVLPVSVLSLLVFVSYFIVIRSMTRQISDEFFITVGRAHGIGEKDLVDKHVTRNIMPQFVSMFALSLGSIISGSMVLEALFSINGMGQCLYKAVLNNDYMLMQGIFFVIIIFTLLSNYVAEMLYGRLDPRINDGRERRDSRVPDVHTPPRKAQSD